MLLRTLLCCSFLASSALAAVSPDWVLVFEDNFKGDKLNTKKWSVIPYEDGTAHIAWKRYQSQDAKLYRFTGKSLQLRGEFGQHRSQNNPDAPQPTYACAGIWSRDTFSFRFGKVEVKARFDGVQGCWPAIWLMPTNGESWPKSGEIDLMEHLNDDNSVYQTVHFCNEGGGATSRTSHKSFDELKLADSSAWHTYGMEWTPDGITFTIDGVTTATRTAAETRHTFGADSKPFHLIIDQQIGGGWVEGSGKKGIDKDTLSRRVAVLEVASVRVWSTPDFRHSTLSEKRSQAAPKPKAAKAEAKPAKGKQGKKGK